MDISSLFRARRLYAHYQRGLFAQIVTLCIDLARRNLPKLAKTGLCTVMGIKPKSSDIQRERTRVFKQRVVLILISVAGALMSGVMVFERLGDSDGTVKAPPTPFDVLAIAQGKTREMVKAETVCLPLVERSTNLVNEGEWDADGPAKMYSVSWVTQCQAQNMTGSNSSEDVGRVTCNGSTYIIKYSRNKDVLRGRVAGLCVNDTTQEQSEFCSDWSKSKGQSEATQTPCQLSAPASSTTAPAASQGAGADQTTTAAPAAPGTTEP